MKKNRTTILKYIIALVVAFQLILLSLPAELIVAKLIGKKYYNIDADYSADPELKARLEYGVFGDALTGWAPVGIAVGAGLLVSLLLWNEAERKKPSNLAFLLLLLALVTFSMTNYGLGYELFEKHIQALSDFIICISGVLVLVKTVTVRTGSAQDVVIKSIIVFFIASQAVLLPGIYAILWHYNIRKYILSANTKILPGYIEIIPSFTNSHLTWISYVTITGGMILSILFYVSASKNKRQQTNRRISNVQQ